MQNLKLNPPYSNSDGEIIKTQHSDSDPQKNKNKKKKAKNKKTSPEGVAMKVKANGASTSSNPFKSISSQRKFEVLGQKRKGDSRCMGLACSLAIQKRNETLLQEYRQCTKSSLFIDKRISENNQAVDDFGKAIL